MFRYLPKLKYSTTTSSTVQNYGHVCVLLPETLNILQVGSGKVYLDLTFGFGNLTKSILDGKADSYVVAVDRDPSSYFRARKLAEDVRYKGRLFPKLLNFGSLYDNPAKLKEILQTLNRIPNLKEGSKFDGIVMDIGVNSEQIDNGDRGFSYLKEGPLDMRMDHHPDFTTEAPVETITSNSIDAYQIVNYFPVDKLVEIFTQYGEERYAKRIANEIVLVRQTKSIDTTSQLKDIILNCCPRYMRSNLYHSRTHPAARTFQSLRIYVNDELNELSKFLQLSPHLLNPSGKLVTITFHSLEDRIVKNYLEPKNPTHQLSRDQLQKLRKSKANLKWNRLKEDSMDYTQLDWETHPSSSTEQFNEVKVVEESAFEYKKKNFIIPSQREMESNPRARSAKLRWATKK